jgi:hypothetical protein
MGNPAAQGAVGQFPCPPGFFCREGGIKQCAVPGTYCKGETPEAMPCPKGSYCPAGATSPTPCTAGKHYCPEQSAAPQDCKDGATCILPAVPELALIPSSIEIVESELTGSFLQYQLSLSTVPSKAVKVTVVPSIREVPCYRYGAKFELEKMVYEFDSINDTVAQNVIVNINRVNDMYEGTFSVTFEHAISTDDENFQSAFLRPVTVVLIDDSPCVDHARQYDDGKIRKCGCMEDFYVESTDPNFCDSVTACIPCPEGMICGFQQDHTTADLVEGFYRTTPSSLNVVKCPDPSTQCVGNARAGKDLCATGYEGPFCMVCVLGEKRYVKSGKECVLCDGSSKTTMYVVLVGAVLILIGVILIINKRLRLVLIFLVGARRPKKDQERRTFPLVERLEVFGGKAQTKYKILVSFGQILTKVAVNYPMQLPSLFTSFWKYFTLFQFDLSLLPINCIVDSNFHGMLVFTTVAPIAFVLFIFLFWVVRWQYLVHKGCKNFTRDLNSLTARSIRMSIIFLFTVFPIVSNTVFQVACF